MDIGRGRYLCPCFGILARGTLCLKNRTMQRVGPGGTFLFCPPSSSIREASGQAEPRVLPGVGALVGGRYRLVRVLGEGQSGKVYRAERIDLPEHHVALKILNSEVYSGRNVEHELKLLSAVAHPHIVQLADHGVGEGYVWFTMPLYAGQPLDVLLRERCLTPREAYDVFGPIAEGLEVLHAVGLRHQDVKPENLFLASFQRSRYPLLLDLGAAAPARAPHPAAGTLLYAAPEQRRALLACMRGEVHQETLTEAVDCYNLAATLLHVLVGDAGFPGQEAERAERMDEVEEILERAALERAVRPLRAGTLRSVPEAAREKLADAFGTWMALDPAARPSMKQLRFQLGVLLEGEVLQQRRRQLRRAVSWAVGAAAAVGLLAVGLQRQKDEHLKLCTRELLSSQQQAVEQVSNLDQCKSLLSAHAQDAQQCHAEVATQRKSLQDAERRRGDGGALQAKLERCEGERRATVSTCNADIETLVKEQTALAMERDLLRSERDQLKASKSKGNSLPAASALAAASVVPAAEHAPAVREGPPAGTIAPASSSVPAQAPAARPGPRARR